MTPPRRHAPTGASLPRSSSRRGERPGSTAITARTPAFTVAGTATFVREQPEDATDKLPGSFHLLWASALALLVIGLVAMYSVSGAAGIVRGDGDGFFYFRQQGLTAAAGLMGLLVLAAVDYRRWRPLIPVGVTLSVFLLLVLLVPGVGASANGATRWLRLGPVTVQPSELAKLALVLGGSYLLAQRRIRRGALAEYGPVLALGLGMCGIIVMQDDLGTALIVAAALLGLLWVGGLRLSQWLGLTALGAAAAVVAIVSAPYRLERLRAFMDPSVDPLREGYQVRQAQIALAEGGFFGVGGGRSVQKYSYLPEAHTDMVFAVLGEEFGILGLALIAGLFVLFALSAFHLARRCRDPFGKYVVAGCAFVIFSQAAINMGGVLGALPLTGVPLPFISFGRNNLVVVMAAVGIILSVARFGPVGSPVTAGEGGPPRRADMESVDVTHLDSRRGDRGSRGTGPRHR